MHQNFWLLSPNNFNSSNANVFNVNSNGNLNNNNSNNSNGVRPYFHKTKSTNILHHIKMHSVKCITRIKTKIAIVAFD